jgi:hypothetical protein
MKKFFYLLIISCAFSIVSFAQGNQPGNDGKLRAKMVEYIEQKLSLSRDETSRFEPVFNDYLKDLKNTNQQYKGDRLVLQDKIVELRLRYRDQFKPILGDKRSNDVFTYERDFVKQVQEIHSERMKLH